MSNKRRKRIRDLTKTGMSRQAATNVLANKLQCLCGHARHEHKDEGCTWFGIPDKAMIGVPQSLVDHMRRLGVPARCPCAMFNPLPPGATVHFGPDDEAAKKALDALMQPPACPFCALAPADLASMTDEEVADICSTSEPTD